MYCHHVYHLALYIKILNALHTPDYKNWQSSPCMAISCKYFNIWLCNVTLLLTFWPRPRNVSYCAILLWGADPVLELTGDKYTKLCVDLQTTFKLIKCRYRVCECLNTAMLNNEGPYRHSTFHTELHSKHSQKKWLPQARDYHHVTLSSIPIL